MSFVEYVDLVTVSRWTIACRIAQLTNLIDTTIRRRIYFNYIDRTSGPNLLTRITDTARLRHRLFGGTTVKRHCQNAGDSGFADPAMSAEDVAVCNSLLRNRILERARYMILPYDVGKLLWPVFSGEDLITHGGTQLIIPTERRAISTQHSALSL